MKVTEILKAPFKGEFCNSKLKINESVEINFILACIFAIVVLISAKTLASDSLTGNMYTSMLGIDSLINQMLVRALILIIINFVAIVLVFSGIIYMINKVIFKLKVSYEEVVSTCTYANIIPTFIMIIGVLFSLFSISLSIVLTIIQILVLIILTYEGVSEWFITGKSKLIYSIAITYIVNTVLFVATNYLIIESMIESRFRNLF